MYVRVTPVFVFVAVLALVLLSVPVRAQTLQNPSFDNWSTPTDPIGWAAVAPVAQQTGARSGPWAVTIKPFGSVSQDLVISQGGYLLAGVWVRSGSAAQMRLTVGAVASCQVGTPTSGELWQQVTCGGVVAPGSHRVTLANAQFSGTTAVVFDDFSVTFTPPASATPTATSTATSTATLTPTATSTSTPTATSTVTATATATSTSTTTPTAAEVPTPTVTPFCDAYCVYLPVALGYRAGDGNARNNSRAYPGPAG
ncbi:MAG TPA: hypothetical protein VFS21_40270 [Roseiflexaceae bacterium]|nr:hypothetical protein [Roseiflexaceae bacterium]